VATRFKNEFSIAASFAGYNDEIMQHPAWNLVLTGLLIAVIGVIWLVSPSIPWLGKLPGDIAIERENFRFYFPLTTCILLSVVMTVILWILRSISK
jgi:hypothetical protein